MTGISQDDKDFVIGNLPQDLDITISQGPPSHLNITTNLDLKQDIGQFGLAGKIWQSAYTLEALFSPDTLIQPSNPIPESYYNTSQAPIPSQKLRILELGAGTGYVGIGLASRLRQPCEIYITDLEQVVPLIQENVDKYHNDKGASVVVDRLHWGNQEDARRLRGQEGFDLVVISDCVYFPELFEILLETLLEVCDASTRVVIGYKCRSLEKETGFWQDYFGRYFEYEPVRKLELVKEDEDEEGHLELGDFLGEEEQLFVFIGKKRLKEDIKKADDTFTTMMFLGISL
ncbi:hypothetical protein K501DRAFT_328108 [Backusella circina FSU 941]|nr:hypothetical protein K501DRAFT_328108 [Backusella circina FSU 941]